MGDLLVHIKNISHILEKFNLLSFPSLMVLDTFK
jgi:hypothetical protein